MDRQQRTVGDVFLLAIASPKPPHSHPSEVAFLYPLTDLVIKFIFD